MHVEKALHDKHTASNLFSQIYIAFPWPHKSLFLFTAKLFKIVVYTACLLLFWPSSLELTLVRICYYHTKQNCSLQFKFLVVYLISCWYLLNFPFSWFWVNCSLDSHLTCLTPHSCVLLVVTLHHSEFWIK